jgi:pimeloyl-ACP methyl ester carboxylesterase
MSAWAHRPNRTLSAMEEKRTTTSRDGTRLAYTKLGSGPAVILVDGAFCYRENGPSAAMAQLLAPHFTVFTYDRRGRGDSSDTAPYAVAREVEDLAAIVREAGGSAAAVGVSSGAALAMQAVASGVPLTKLALYEPPFVTDQDRPGLNGNPRAHLQELVDAGDRRGAVRYFLADLVRVPRPIVLAMPFFMRRTWKKNESVAHTLPYDLTILDDRSVIEDRRASIAVPSLVVGGAKSPEMLKRAVTAVAEALPNARSRFLDGQTHDLQPAVLVPVLREFFAAP